ncbi:unnamed protein product, partial [Prorocentrum cordatum]
WHDCDCQPMIALATHLIMREAPSSWPLDWPWPPGKTPRWPEWTPTCCQDGPRDPREAPLCVPRCPLPPPVNPLEVPGGSSNGDTGSPSWSTRRGGGDGTPGQKGGSIEGVTTSIPPQDIDLEDEDLIDESDLQETGEPAVQKKREVTAETAEHIFLNVKNVGEAMVHSFWRVPDGPDAGSERYFGDILPGAEKQYYTLAHQTWVVREGATPDSKLVRTILTRDSPKRQDYTVGGPDDGAADDPGESLDDIDLEDIDLEDDEPKEEL